MGKGGVVYARKSWVVRGEEKVVGREKVVTTVMRLGMGKKPP
jgi:hypothetical protein